MSDHKGLKQFAHKPTWKGKHFIIFLVFRARQPRAAAPADSFSVACGSTLDVQTIHELHEKLKKPSSCATLLLLTYLCAIAIPRRGSSAVHSRL